MADEIANLFVHRPAAQRYAAARPYFHPVVIEKIAAFTGVNRVARALDVACGTGQSTQALAAIANEIDAVDISADMLAECRPQSGVRFRVASAERLPFPDTCFDLVTVGLAFHWFDQPAFLAEASRTLKPNGWLVIYNSGFNGEMAEDPAFRQWAWEVYPARFPAPPRHVGGITDALVEPHGFTLAGKDGFRHDEQMTADQLTAYLLTQTNVIAHVEQGTMPLPEAAAWIHAGVQQFFAVQTRTMKFGGNIWFMQRCGGH